MNKVKLVTRPHEHDTYPKKSVPAEMSLGEIRVTHITLWYHVPSRRSLAMSPLRSPHIVESFTLANVERHVTTSVRRWAVSVAAKAAISTGKAMASAR